MLANVIQGEGTLEKSNGDTYVGEFQNGQFNGQGTYRWRDPNYEYKGWFMNGLFHGQGTFKNQSGLYEGEFKKGMMEGRGIMDFCNGDKYTGEF